MSFKYLILEKKDGIAWIKFNRPDVFNAMNRDVYGEIDKALDDIENDPESRVIVITGEGKAFAAGADIKYMLEEMPAGTDGYELSVYTHKVFDHLANLNKPSIAAINGMAFGAGLEIALCCDIRIASEKARLGLPEVTLGLIPGAGGTQRLQRVVGPGWAKHMILTADPIRAQEAFSMGLVTKIVSPEELIDAATEMAGKLLTVPTYAMKGAKILLDEGADINLKSAKRFEEAMFGLVFSTEDRMEGLKAFAEKRDAGFKDR